MAVKLRRSMFSGLRRNGIRSGNQNIHLWPTSVLSLFGARRRVLRKTTFIYSLSDRSMDGIGGDGGTLLLITSGAFGVQVGR